MVSCITLPPSPWHFTGDTRTFRPLTGRTLHAGSLYLPRCVNSMSNIGWYLIHLQHMRVQHYNNGNSTVALSSKRAKSVAAVPSDSCLSKAQTACSFYTSYVSIESICTLLLAFYREDYMLRVAILLSEGKRIKASYRPTLSISPSFLSAPLHRDRDYFFATE